MIGDLKKKIKHLATRHVPSGEPNVFIHSLPRSGSTWLMELVLTQPGFKGCNEPLNLNREVARDYLGLRNPVELHYDTSRESIGNYLEDIASGRLRDWRFNSPAPFTEFYRPITRRVVFKILHAAQEHIGWLAERCNGRVILLMRHPVPVSLSRKQLPKLQDGIDPVFRGYFTDAQFDAAERIARSDDRFALALLDWCLHTSLALRSRAEGWVILSYEQLVLDPRPAIETMAERLGLPDPERMMARLTVPSTSTSQSDRGTRDVLNKATDVTARSWLVRKWQESVDAAQVRVADELLDTFNLGGLYRATEALPNNAYWIEPAARDTDWHDHAAPAVGAV